MLRSYRLRRSGKTSQRTQTENDIGGFSAYSGVVDWAKMREIVTASVLTFSLIWRTLRAWLLWRLPEPGSSCSRCYYHHSQNLAGPRGGLILAKGGSEELYKN